jgi:hypothetical protein
MTEQDAVHTGTGSQLLVGAFLGALLGLLTGVIPVAALFVVPGLLAYLAASLIARPIRYDRLTTFGGALIGGGAFYAYGVANTVLACVGTADFCGRADVLPLTVVAASLLAIGIMMTITSGRRGRP